MLIELFLDDPVIAPAIANAALYYKDLILLWNGALYV